MNFSYGKMQYLDKEKIASLDFFSQLFLSGISVLESDTGIYSVLLYTMHFFFKPTILNKLRSTDKQKSYDFLFY